MLIHMKTLKNEFILKKLNINIKAIFKSNCCIPYVILAFSMDKQYKQKREGDKKIILN